MRRDQPSITAAVMVLVLTGCASSANPSPETLRTERIASWQRLCDARGFTRGTPDFQDCVMGYDREASNPPIK